MKVAIIGCGRIAQTRHIPEYENNKNTEIVGLYDLNYERAKELAEKLNAKAFKSIEELLADESIEAVSICTANVAHAENTIAALKAGKHVLCEKPMATTMEECVEMVRVAKECNKKLMIDQNQRLLKTHQRAKELIEQGVIGKVITFKTTFGHKGPENWSIAPGASTWFFDKKQSAIGAMADLGIHKVDLMQYLLNTKVKKVTARLMTLEKKDEHGNPISVDDNAFSILEMENGCAGSLCVSWTYYGEEDNSTFIYGSKGMMKIFGDSDYSINVFLRDGQEILFSVDSIQTNDNQTDTGIIDAFADCVINDKKPLIDGEDVLDAMKAIFACIKSSEEGITVEV